MTHDDPSGRAWFVAQRWQEYNGEARANLLRIIGIAVFYGLHLAHHYGLGLGIAKDDGLAATENYHTLVSLIAMVWVLGATGVHACLRQRFFPTWLKYASTTLDIVLLSAVLCVSNGPRSPMVVGYFVVLAMASLRFSLNLLWCATPVALLGYLTVLAVARWPETLIRTTVDLRVPRYHQAMVLSAILLCGVVLGQIIRQSRKLAAEYAQHVGNQPEQE